MKKLQNFKNKMASFYFPQFEHEIFGDTWVDWMNFVLNVLIIVLRNEKFAEWSLRVLMMNIGVMLRLCTLRVWKHCYMVILIEFGILVCYFRISIYPCNFVFEVIETGMSHLGLLTICYCFLFLFNFLFIKTEIVSQLLLYLHEFLYLRVFFLQN